MHLLHIDDFQSQKLLDAAQRKGVYFCYYERKSLYTKVLFTFFFF